MTSSTERPRGALGVADLRLLLVTDEVAVADRDWVEVCLAAVAGGVTAIQVRHGSATARELAALARRIMAAVAVPVFVNDRLDVALAVGAAGAHLGRDDVPVSLARKIAPPAFVVGASVGQEDEVLDGSRADYWGVGPFRVSPSKAAGPAIGLEGFAGFLGRAQSVPCVAIGGVRPEDVSALAGCGAAGVAVVSGILGHDDISGAARR